MVPYFRILTPKTPLTPSIVIRQSTILLFLISWSAISLAQTPSYTIYGIVRLPNGEVAPRVTVHINSQSGFDRQVFSDDMGRYEIRDLPRGRYFLTVVNPAEPDQFTDPVEADTGRSFAGRLLVHIYLRAGLAIEPSTEKAPRIISVTEATQRVPKAAQKAFEKALKERAERELDRALKNFTRSIDIYPAYFQALTERGHLRITLGQVDEAAEDFARALALDPNYGPALRGSGICKFEQGKFEEAVRDLESSLASEPNIATTYLFLGVANLALDRRDSSRGALERALSLDPAGAARAHVHLANIHLKDQRLEEAAREIQLYLDAEPDAPDATKLRAVRDQIRAQMSKP